MTNNILINKFKDEIVKDLFDMYCDRVLTTSQLQEEDAQLSNVNSLRGCRDFNTKLQNLRRNHFEQGGEFDDGEGDIVG